MKHLENILGIRIHHYRQKIVLKSSLLKIMKNIKNNEIVNQAVYSMNELRNAIVRKEIPEAENPDKIFGTVEKSPRF